MEEALKLNDDIQEWFNNLYKCKAILAKLSRTCQYNYVSEERDEEWQHFMWTALLIVHETQQLN